MPSAVGEKTRGLAWPRRLFRSRRLHRHPHADRFQHFALDRDGVWRIVAMLASLPIGWLCFSLRGPYFTIATLATAQALML